MQQHNTWMRYLTLGLIISSITFFSACKKVNYAQFGEFYFVNETNHSISFEKGLEQFNLAPKAVFFIKQTQDSGKDPSVSIYQSPIMKLSNGLVNIKFDMNKCIAVTYYTEHSILDIKNFISEKISKRTYKFTYTFTEADYNRAVTCP